jgi:hypothetical protein
LARKVTATKGKYKQQEKIMKSMNHQFLEFSDQVLKRYVKVGIEALTGYRLNPRNAVNPNERIDFLLATPEENVQYTPYNDGEPTKVKQVKFSYEDEVLELYTAMEVKSFERMNRLLIENGLLVEYSEQAPEVDKVNVISDTELNRLARTKTLALFKDKVNKLTSIHTLNSLLDLMDNIDTVTNAQMKAVRERINELKSG